MSGAMTGAMTVTAYALLARAEGWARDRGLARITLETGAANARARGFYGALGYLEEEVRLTRILTSP